MKRLTCFLLVLSMLMELCACAGVTGADAGASNGTSSEMGPEEIVPEQVDVPALIEQGESYVKKGDPLSMAYAEACFAEAMAEEPSNGELYTKRAELHLKAGDAKLAAEIMALGAEKADPEFRDKALAQAAEWREQAWQSYCANGDEAVAQEDRVGAILAYTEAIEADPARADALVKRGDVYRMSASLGEEAAEDYAAALSLDPNQEELYIKLADLYTEQDEPEKAMEILERGVSTLNTKVLKQKRLEQEAAQYSDQDLLRMVNDSMLDLYYLEYGLYNGAEFEISGEKSYPDPAHPDDPDFVWLLVDDPRASSLKDISKIWKKHYSADYPEPKWEHYKEINGELYSDCLGIGGMDMWLDGFEVNTVWRRDGLTAILCGARNCFDYMNNDAPYQEPFVYYMVYENGLWKCGGYAIYLHGEWDFSGWNSRKTTAADLPDPKKMLLPDFSGPDRQPPVQEDVPVQTLAPIYNLEDSDVWTGADQSLLINAASALNTQIGCASDGRKMAILNGFLKYKPFILACREEQFIQTLGGEYLQEVEQQVWSTYGSEQSWTDQAYGMMAGAIQEIMFRYPEYLRVLFGSLLAKHPEILLSIVSQNNRNHEVSFPQDILAGIEMLEKSVLKYRSMMDLTEEIERMEDKYTEKVRPICQELWENYSSTVSTVILLGNQKLNGNRESADRLARRVFGCAARDDLALYFRIEALQTFRMKTFHRRLNGKLNELKERIDSLSSDYQAIYWSVSQDFVQTGGGGLVTMPRAPIQLDRDTERIVVAEYLGADEASQHKVNWISGEDAIVHVVKTQVSGNRISAVVRGMEYGVTNLMLYIDGRLREMVTVSVRQRNETEVFAPVEQFPVPSNANVLPYSASLMEISGKEEKPGQLIQLRFDRGVQPGYGSLLLLEYDTGRLVEKFELSKATFQQTNRDGWNDQVRFMMDRPLAPDTKYYLYMEDGLFLDQIDPRLRCAGGTAAEDWVFQTVPLSLYEEIPKLTEQDILFRFPEFLGEDGYLEGIRETYRDALRQSSNDPTDETGKKIAALAWTVENFNPMLLYQCLKLPDKAERGMIRTLFLHASENETAIGDIVEGMGDDLNGMAAELLKFTGDMSLDDFIELQSDLTLKFSPQQVKDLVQDMKADKEFCGKISRTFEALNWEAAVFAVVSNYLMMQEVPLELMDTMIRELEENGLKDQMYTALCEERETYFLNVTTWSVAKDILLDPDVMSAMSDVIQGLRSQSGPTSLTGTLATLCVKCIAKLYNEIYPNVEDYFNFYAAATYAGRLCWLLEHKRYEFRQHSADAEDVESFRVLYSLYCAALIQTCEGVRTLSEPFDNVNSEYLEKCREQLQHRSLNTYLAECLRLGKGYLNGIRLYM